MTALTTFDQPDTPLAVPEPLLSPEAADDDARTVHDERDRQQAAIDREWDSRDRDHAAADRDELRSLRPPR